MAAGRKQQCNRQVQRSVWARRGTSRAEDPTAISVSQASPPGGLGGEKEKKLFGVGAKQSKWVGVVVFAEAAAGAGGERTGWSTRWITRRGQRARLSSAGFVWSGRLARLGSAPRPSVRSAAACSSVSSSARTNQQDSLVGRQSLLMVFLPLRFLSSWPRPARGQFASILSLPRASPRLSAWSQIRHNGTFRFNLLATTTRDDTGW